MATHIEAFRHLLQQSGYRVTRAREAVFTVLLGREPLTMHALVAMAKGVDRASVYRTVALFERLGITHQLNIGWKYKIELSDMFNEHHHHFTCLRCGQATPMNDQTIEHLVNDLAAAHGFMPTAHQIEIQGNCARCQHTKPSNN